MQHKQHILKWFLLILLTASIALSTQAGELLVEVADYKLDRLYFPIGEESRVYENSRFVIYHEDDSIYSGRIEHAWLGVSISGPTGQFFDSLDADSLHAAIETAELDTASPILIGTDLIGLQLWSEGARPDRVEIREYEDRLSMLEDFHSDFLDGLFSFETLSPRPEGVTTISRPAPYLVVMIPNIGRDANFQGQLTTSLYYRFDRARLAFSFDGDQLTMTNRFEADSLYDLPRKRLFEYDPGRGRQLFELMTYPLPWVAFHSSHASLDGLMHYFADIVSRDRCNVVLVNNSPLADVRLAFVPISKSLPSVTIYSLFHQLIIDSVADMAANEHVRRIAAELRYVEAPSRPEDYYRHLRNAGRIMSEDLGLFPLFRPTVFVHTHRRLQELDFNDDNQLDLSTGTLMKLPRPAEDDAP